MVVARFTSYAGWEFVSPSLQWLFKKHNFVIGAVPFQT